MTGGMRLRQYVGPMSLISAATLMTQLAAGYPYALCDMRYSLTDPTAGRRQYQEGHLPGAVYVDLHDDLADTGLGGGRHPLPTTAAFGQVLQRLGIAPETPVVAYDAAGGTFAARLWWMLRAVGHQQVAVLDGGFPAWIRAGGPVTATVAPQPSTLYPVPETWPGVVDADGVVAAGAEGRLVVDCRAPERFRGEVEPLDPRAGHIPGAINLFQGDNLDADGSHRPLGELRQRFAFLAEADRPVFYCGSGVSACHNLLAMHASGLPNANAALLYAGSWSDWTSQAGRPVAVGDT